MKNAIELPPPKTLIDSLRYAAVMLDGYIHRTGDSFLVDTTWPESVGLSGPFVDAIRRDLRQTALHRVMYGWSVYWMKSGFPVVEPSHKLSASLMCTSGTADDVVVPWTHFLVRIPSGIVSVTNGSDDVQRDTKYMFVSSWDRKLCALVATADNALWCSGTRDLVDFGESDLSDVPLIEPGLASFDDQDIRVRKLLDRFLLGVCREMSSPDVLRDFDRRGAHRQGSIQVQAGTGNQLFKLGRPVTVDCREAVRGYARGERGTALTTRWMTRGHWRLQPYGPMSTLRRWQQIEPHWNTRADLPIVVRPHRMGA